MIINEFKPILLIVAVFSGILLVVVTIGKKKMKSELVSSEFTDDEKILEKIRKYDMLGDAFLVAGLFLMFLSPNKYSLAIMIVSLSCITLTSVMSILQLKRK